ncbi:conserved hypothetical protein [Leishmania braziliensis MHOM/BR/75/M2904]|uniref:Uncharacterized protein n=2 Tax=Leishmania braziliensis TaxID=5660 RepID=A4HPT4_LEIBR|nr:conserved hypothetical protein [Leishmania braziliensis MHOM/BR/75/M2904]CAJ2481824.1 unnamed protein product [Leishmania braziliensis]CAM44192.2 conserved hypothetical protein [Leishmania braziliensis MHOM/BR/75/M2904]
MPMMSADESHRASAAAKKPAAAPTFSPFPPCPARGATASAMAKSNMPSSSAASGVAAAAAPSKETSSKAMDLDPTTASLECVLQIGQPTFSTQLDFIKVNRAVASLERAVERLELLSLLDATGPTPSTEGNHKNANGAVTASNATAVTSATTAIFHPHNSSRGPAVLTGISHDASVATAQKVAEVLAATQQQRGCGRASVLKLLAEQRVLERRYGELLTQAQPTVSLYPGEPQLRSKCFAQAGDPAQATLQRELALVSNRLRETNRLLCTQLQDNPQDRDNWAKVCNERQELIALLREVTEELTVGYKEAFQQRQGRQQQQQANVVLDGGLKRSSTPGGIMEGVRFSCATSNGDFLGLNSNGTSAPGLARNDSRQSSTIGGGPISTESGSRTSPFHKCFGGTLQRHRTSRTTQQGPRIPLTSSYQQFAVKILQEEASQRWADDMLAKERALNQNVKQLQADLERERELKDKEVAERLAHISTLKLELRKLKASLQQRSEAAKARGEAATENLQREGAAEVRGVRQATQHNEQLLAISATAHDTFSSYLRERTAAMDTLASEWEAKTLRELKKKEAAKIDAEGSRQACAQRLTDLQHERDVQQELKEQRDSAQRAEEDDRRRSEEQRDAEYAAASVLEAALKAMMTRQALSKLQKGSKKKKKAAG